MRRSHLLRSTFYLIGSFSTVHPAPVACKLKCVLSLVRKQKLFHFVYLNMKGFVLSFHQRFYKPHSNSESAQKHLNFVNWTLLPAKRFWLVVWIFCGKLSTIFNGRFLSDFHNVINFFKMKIFGLNFVLKTRKLQQNEAEMHKAYRTLDKTYGYVE